MTSDENERLKFLIRVTEKEVTGLQKTHTRLFNGKAPTEADVVFWVADDDFSERLDAYAGRYSRLQDTVGDKLLPALLKHLGEPVKAHIDNLDKAERLGWLHSADQWMVLRQLRNKFVHEYMEDTAMLADALAASQNGLPLLIDFAQNLIAETKMRIAKISDSR